VLTIKDEGVEKVPEIGPPEACWFDGRRDWLRSCEKGLVVLGACWLEVCRCSKCACEGCCGFAHGFCSMNCSSAGFNRDVDPTVRSAASS